ncbi:MAG: divergent polysaccharide deacetylase family protein [Maricaulaceae bacterium]|jgi:polysaccharide deacetylase 2 family uncharacterized protein YibQ
MARLRALAALLKGRLSQLLSKLPGDRRTRMLAGGGGAAAFGIIGFFALTDPASGYAVARIELPAFAENDHAASAETQHASAEDHAAAPANAHDDAHTESGEHASGPRPAPLFEPLIELRPAEDPAVEPRLAGIEDLSAHGGAHTPARAARPVATDGGGLAPAPIHALTRAGPGGLLPRIGPDGLTPAAAYARPFARENEAPAIAIVVGGLGLNASATREAIETLPDAVTLAFVPYAENLQGWIDAARAAGHEVILELPMEPYDYPANDPGPHTLLAGADPDENRRRLEWLMSRGTGYFAVMNYMGARFTAEPDALAPAFGRIAETGVAFLYDGETRRADLDVLAVDAHLSAATADRILDEHPTAAAIDEHLLELEALALQNGDAIGAGFGYPVTVRQIRDWSGALALKGYVLAPVSAVLENRAAAAQSRVAEAANVAPAARASYSRLEASFGGDNEEDAPPSSGH